LLKPARTGNLPAVFPSRRDITMAKLTEQDILNWNGDESDYMNADQLEFFRERLLQMQQELLNNADATTNHLQEQEATPDPADRATLEEEYALELRTRDRERKLLLKIQSTLRKIEDGSYGFCEDTGEPIGLKRLLARPTASLSVEAQERRERLKKQFAD
jgi:DnaK suppressor protein